MKRRSLALVVLLVVLLPAGAFADRVPVPDPAFASNAVPSSDCNPETEYEADRWWSDGPGAYGESCRRLHFSFGPILVKPGQNDVLLQPVTIEKPAYHGFIVRFKPDLVDATGVAPAIEEVHLHHGTWLNAYPEYGDGPFFAAGEEKTIATFPKGYGMEVKPSDIWLMLYMVHNAQSTPRLVWITYDIDYVAAEDAQSFADPSKRIANVKPMWLDVQGSRIHPDAPSTGGNPVFNVHKGFGSLDPETGLQACTWPLQNCGRHDVYGKVTPQQGVPITIKGADKRVSAEMAGTIIGLGGHLHPGGIRDEVSVVRGGTEKMIHISDAVYWNPADPDSGDGPPNSWDFSMTVTGSPLDWKVKVKEGDVLRLNAVYESQYASWYENMGIVVALIAPDDPHAPAGVDVFDEPVTISREFPAQVKLPKNQRIGSFVAEDNNNCVPNLVGPAKVLCMRGQITHGHMEEATNRGGRNLSAPGTELTWPDGELVQNIPVAGFTYGPAELGVAVSAGVPLVKKGVPVRFWNLETSADIWHTITRCKEPCNGSTGLDYPLADASTGPADTMDFDSTEIGYGVFFSPASGQIGGDVNKDPRETFEDGLFWDFTPTQTGTFTFWCRIHPSMRGVIRVIE